MNTTNLAVLLIVLCVSSCDGGGGKDVKDDEYYSNKMIAHLNQSSEWLIEEGVYSFSQSGRDGLLEVLRERWAGVQLSVGPWIEKMGYSAHNPVNGEESGRYINGFWIKSRGIGYQVFSLYREEYRGRFYEFWFVKVVGQDWAEFQKRTEFFIVTTDSVYGRREVLKRDNQFIPEFVIDSDYTISFPQDNPDFLSELEAWEFPENYKNSDLDEKKVR